MIDRKKALELVNIALFGQNLKRIEEIIVSAANIGLIEIKISELNDYEMSVLQSEDFLIKKVEDGFIINWQNPSWSETPPEIIKTLVNTFKNSLC